MANAPKPSPSTIRPYVDEATGEVRLPPRYTAWILAVLLGTGGLANGGIDFVKGLFTTSPAEAVTAQTETLKVISVKLDAAEKRHKEDMTQHEERPHEGAADKDDMKLLADKVHMLTSHQGVMQYQLNEQTQVGKETLEVVKSLKQ